MTMTLGVVADTHVPDRARSLPARVLDVFRQAHVHAILHAGDVVHPRVLHTLAAIAPVHAVRGNRDVYFLRSLPARWEGRFEGITVGMMHGHGTWRQYFADKWHHFRHGVPFSRFERRALAAFPHADVVVFGHTHYPVCRWVGARLLCNPGSPVRPIFRHLPPSVALLHIEKAQVWGEIIVL